MIVGPFIDLLKNICVNVPQLLKNILTLFIHNIEWELRMQTCFNLIKLLWARGSFTWRLEFFSHILFKNQYHTRKLTTCLGLGLHIFVAICLPLKRQAQNGHQEVPQFLWGNGVSVHSTYSSQYFVGFPSLSRTLSHLYMKSTLFSPSSPCYTSNF